MKHLILGNGPAGVVAAETLRKHAPADAITLVGDEPGPPYSRMAIPYLLMGRIEEPGTWLRKDAAHFDRLGIALKEGRARSVDTKARAVSLESGESLAYDRLLVATGSTPNRPPIPGIDLPGVIPCWTLADARAIMALARPGSRVVQMGAGFIGCIILEALAKRGVELTVVEMGDRMVPRMMTEGASRPHQGVVRDEGRARHHGRAREVDHGLGRHAHREPRGRAGAAGRPRHLRHGRHAQHRVPRRQRHRLRPGRAGRRSHATSRCGGLRRRGRRAGARIRHGPEDRLCDPAHGGGAGPGRRAQHGRARGGLARQRSR